jgi:hypothetical protein
VNPEEEYTEEITENDLPGNQFDFYIRLSQGRMSVQVDWNDQKLSPIRKVMFTSPNRSRLESIRPDTIEHSSAALVLMLMQICSAMHK